MDALTTLAVSLVSLGFVIIRFNMLVKERKDPRAIGMWPQKLRHRTKSRILFLRPGVNDPFDLLSVQFS
ncbi:hypothetical protein ACFLXQ_04075 [Chloroflexota bacterium]